MSMLPIDGQPYGGMDPVFSQGFPMMPAPQPRRSGGMFGAGGVGRGIAGAIGDYLLQLNRMQPIYAPAMQQRQEMRQREEQYQRQRSDGREDFLWKQDHTTPQPTQTDRYLDEYMNPSTDPRRKAALGQILFPPVMGVVNGQSSIIDRAAMLGGGGQPQSPPPQAINDLKANPQSAAQFNEIFGQGAAERILGAGGPTPQASGGFPRPY